MCFQSYKVYPDRAEKVNPPNPPRPFFGHGRSQNFWKIEGAKT